MGSRLGILWRGIIEEVPLHLRRRGWQEPFGRLLDESQKRIPLRLFDIAIEKVETGSNQACGAKASFNPRSTGCQGKGFIA
jgi:hypothetical protein